MNISAGAWVNIVIIALALGVCTSFIGAIMGVRSNRWFWIFIATALIVGALGVVAAYYSAQGAP